MRGETSWRRRAVIFGIPIAVVAAAVGALAVLTVGDNDDHQAAVQPKRVRLVAPTRVPRSPEKPAFPAAPTGQPEPEGSGAAIPLPTATADSTWDKLVEKAKDDGSLPVIITLRPRIRPEGALTAVQRTTQRRRIETVGDRVLDGVSGDVEHVNRFEAVPIVTLKATPQALEELRDSPDVISVAEDVPVPLRLPPQTVPPQAAQGARSWSTGDRWWQLSRDETDTAWSKGYDGTGQTVAVLDTGVQSDHPWLAGKVVSEACFSYAGSCSGGATIKYGTGSAAPCTFVTVCGHGTHVAHDAAGKYGVARNAKIIALRVFSRSTQCTGGATVCALAAPSDQLKALERVYQLRNTYRIAAVNISIGGGKSANYCDSPGDSYTDWLRTLQAVGIATIIATGNEAFTDGVDIPSCHASAIAAGGTSLDSNGSDAMYYFSNSSPQIFNLLAPGEYICSAWPTSTLSCGNGTSYATPQITGAFATLRQLKPSASITSIRNSIICSGAGMRDRSGVVRARLRMWNALIALYNNKTTC
jgi:subtilisin